MAGLSLGAGNLQQILGSFASRPVYVPHHNIGQIDSRWWDPEWNRTYGKSYNALFRAYNYGLANSSKAFTAASNESYFWGARGGSPSGVLKKFSNMKPQKVIKRINRWFAAMGRGQTLEDLILNFLRAVADPGQAMEQQPDAPDETLY